MASRYTPTLTKHVTHHLLGSQAVRHLQGTPRSCPHPVCKGVMLEPSRALLKQTCSSVPPPTLGVSAQSPPDHQSLAWIKSVEEQRCHENNKKQETEGKQRFPDLGTGYSRCRKDTDYITGYRVAFKSGKSGTLPSDKVAETFQGYSVHPDLHLACRLLPPTTPCPDHYRDPLASKLPVPSPSTLPPHCHLGDLSKKQTHDDTGQQLSILTGTRAERASARPTSRHCPQAPARRSHSQGQSSSCGFRLLVFSHPVPCLDRSSRLAHLVTAPCPPQVSPALEDLPGSLPLLRMELPTCLAHTSSPAPSPRNGYYSPANLPPHPPTETTTSRTKTGAGSRGVSRAWHRARHNAGAHSLPAEWKLQAATHREG